MKQRLSLVVIALVGILFVTASGFGEKCFGIACLVIAAAGVFVELLPDRNVPRWTRRMSYEPTLKEDPRD